MARRLTACRFVGTGRELQLRTAMSAIQLLRSAADGTFREVTSQVDWASFHGQFSGNRYSTMTQIDKANVSRLAPKWVFPVPNAGPPPGHADLVEGIMYVPATNTVIALDAGSGARLWTVHAAAHAGTGGQRKIAGVTIAASPSAGDRCLHADRQRAFDRAQSFLRQGALGDGDGRLSPELQRHRLLLALENLVVAGTAGGEKACAGFWRPTTRPPEKRSGGSGRSRARRDGIGDLGWPRHRSRRRSHLADGSYDPETKTVYWPSGNAGPDFNGDNRKGDNLYTCSILAIDVTTGKLKWHFQATPHDEWDWDAVQPLVLVDAQWQGRPRKLLLQANRNGFLYVLDRTDGQMLLAKPLVKKLTWAKEIGIRWPSRDEPEPDADSGRESDLSLGGRRDQFFLHLVQPGNGAVLREHARKVQHLYQALRRPNGAPAADMRAAADASRRTTSRKRFCAPLTFTTGKAVVGTTARRPGRYLERHPLHGGRTGVLRRRRNRTGRGRCLDGQETLELSVYRYPAHFADDVYVR